MKVFLTGGTGFIGKPLTRQLLKRGWQVTALVRNPDSPQSRAISEMGAALVKGDVTDKESMRAGMTGVDIVVHNAAWFELGISRKVVDKMFDINVGGTEKVLSLALELGIKLTIYVSSLVAFGDSGSNEQDETFTRQARCTSAYEQSKADAHQVALEYQKRGSPVIIVCPGNVIGPNDHSVWGYFARLYVNNILPPFAWAKNVIYRHALVDDTAEAIVLAAEKGKPGEMYFIGGDSVQMHETLELWFETPGGLKALFYLPNRIASFMFATLEPLQRLVGLPAFISRETVGGSSINYSYSNQKARRELGWAPKPVREVWMETLAAERELRTKRKKRDLVSMLKPLDE